MTARACPRCGRPPESHPPQNAAEANSGGSRAPDMPVPQDAVHQKVLVAPLLATRTMRARHPGTCAVDNCAIFRGDRIGLVPGLGWCRTVCINRRNRETSTEETTRP